MGHQTCGNESFSLKWVSVHKMISENLNFEVLKENLND